MYLGRDVGYGNYELGLLVRVPISTLFGSSLSLGSDVLIRCCFEGFGMLVELN